MAESTKSEAQANAGAAGVLAIDGVLQHVLDAATFDPTIHAGFVSQFDGGHLVKHEDVAGQFSAEIDVTGCNLHQVEMALQGNRHTHDPHPGLPGEYLRRHPVYLIGTPSELDLETMRSMLAKRHPHLSPTAPPEDGAHRSGVL